MQMTCWIHLDLSVYRGNQGYELGTSILYNHKPTLCLDLQRLVVQAV
uniref:Uncharacterized protein n=1 Tax=Anguilla anguilla TaxID=7936 RepID=A0A0E9QV49_ANGAN